MQLIWEHPDWVRESRERIRVKAHTDMRTDQLIHASIDRLWWAGWLLSSTAPLTREHTGRLGNKR